MTPLFMWAGGKTKLINNQYKPFLPDNFDKYHEPFFGGGAMFAWAYQKNPRAKFFINDINKPIINIYKSIRDDYKLFTRLVDNLEADYLSLDPPTEKVVESIVKNNKLTKKTQWLPHPSGAKDSKLEKKFKLPGNKYDWHSIHSQKPTRRTFFFKTRQMYQEDYSKWIVTEESAILYFLMKTAFNGVWQLGKNHGRFNTPCGLMRHTDSIYDKDNLLQWHVALQKCEITSVDFFDTLTDIDSGSFVFLDPPYRSASEEEKTFADYGTELNDSFQEKVLNFFHKSCNNSQYTMLSNRDWGDGFFEKRSEGCDIKYFDITYTVGRKKKEKSGSHSAKKAVEILMLKGK